jgi:serine/threonine protein phosphatase PrpC
VTSDRHRELRVVAFAATDVGRLREGNEDSHYRGSSVFAVADGMGGHQAGEVASETALEPLLAVDGRDFASAEDAERMLVEAIRAANRDVVAKADANPEFQGMGTTLTAVLVRDGELHIAHVGDSRAYLLRRGERINQLTTDHTLVEELVQEGRLSRDEVATHPQRSIITRAIGVEWDVEVDTLPPLQLQVADQVLLCSDGLSGPVSDAQIGEILERYEDGDAACRALLDAANAAGGPDNITVVLLRVIGRDEGTPPGGTALEAVTTTDLRGARGGTATALDARAQAEAETQPAEDQTLDEARVDSGATGTPTPRRRDRRGARRVLVGLLVTAIGLGAAAGIGYWLLSRSYFVGDDNGRVAVFRGLPLEVAGLPLNWVAERTDLRTSDLQPIRRDRLRSGISVQSLAEGRRYVDETLRADAAAAARARQPAPGLHGLPRRTPPPIPPASPPLGP